MSYAKIVSTLSIAMCLAAAFPTLLFASDERSAQEPRVQLLETAFTPVRTRGIIQSIDPDTKQTRIKTQAITFRARDGTVHVVRVLAISKKAKEAAIGSEVVYVVNLPDAEILRGEVYYAKSIRIFEDAFQKRLISDPVDAERVDRTGRDTQAEPGATDNPDSAQVQAEKSSSI